MTKKAESGSLSKRALRALASLQARVDALEQAASEPIAITGIGCRFPGQAVSPQAFWDLLRSGTDAIRELPAERWRIDDYYHSEPATPGKIYVRNGGFLDRIDGFDARFFGISPREAVAIDPQHRLLLEVVWEALENAGIAPDSLAGTCTGVFVGIGQDDYAQLGLRSPAQETIDTYDGTGNLFCFAPGRVAYLLGLQGPNLAIDTACSSSLVALHQACLSLRAGDCNLALAGGVHLVVTPEVTLFLSQARVLSPEGRCRTFDAAADGFSRGEGCGMVVLKRLSDAIAGNDPILAVIRGSAVNHDGASSGLTVPNEQAQLDLVRKALANARVEPGQVSLVEAHGTGTVLGDPIEVNALAAALCSDRSPDSPLLLGSVKTNIGHLEAAAGIAGVIKVVLALHHQEIPPHLHFHEPNPNISWSQLPIEVPVACRPWLRGEATRLAGVSSFGFSGTNAHVVLEEAPEATTASLQVDSRPLLLPLSAKSAPALIELAERYQICLDDQGDDNLGDICASASLGRAHMKHRLALVTGSVAEARQQLAAFARGENAAGLHHGAALPGHEESPADSEWSMQELARAYANGAFIDWRELYPGSFRSIGLPTYPFQRQCYWLTTTDDRRHTVSSLPSRSEPAHPLLGRRLLAAFLDDNEVVFEARVSSGSPGFLAHHRVFGSAVLPAAAFFEIGLATAAELLGTGPVALRTVDIQQALILPEQSEVLIQTTLTRDGPDSYRFRIDSLDQRRSQSWTLHATGWITSGQQAPQTPGELQGPVKEIDVAAHYQAMAARNIDFGASFRSLERVGLAGNEVAGQVRLPARLQTDAGAYRLHPALLDGCFQAAVAAFPEEMDDHTLLPVGCDQIWWSGSSPSACRSRARLQTVADAGHSLTVDLDLRDDSGAAVASVTGLSLVPAHASTLLRGEADSTGDWLYRLAWEPVPALPATTEQGAPGRWLIFADQQGIGAGLAEQLTELGAEVTLVAAGKQYRNDGAGLIHLDPEHDQSYRHLLNEITAAGPLRGVVHLWSLDSGSELSDEAIARARALGTLSSLYLVQALLEQGLRDSLSCLWLVTRGALAVDPVELPPRIEQSALWGLERVIAIEHPELGSSCIDLDPAAEQNPDTIGMLCDVVTRRAATESFALRNRQLLRARLTRHQPEPGRQPAIDTEATYLVAGGLGALGLRVAQWLTDQGARYLALCGRNQPSQAARQLIDDLTSRDVTVVVSQADIADAGQVQQLLHTIGDSMPPLRGIVNAAGVVEDATLQRLGSEQLARVMAPKVAGSWNLHRLTSELPLDLFVCFSSAAGVIGSPGQGAYAAANTFVDALATLRRSNRQPSLSIALGPWAEVGMAAQLDAAQQERLRARGMTSIPPDTGIGLLERLLAGDEACVAVLPIDWQQYLTTTYQGPAPGLFDRLRPAVAKPQPAAKLNQLHEQLAAANQEERRSILASFVCSQVAATLGIAAADSIEPRESLFDLGVDSLMAIELRNRIESRLGSRLRSTTLFDFPTVEQLATHLHDDVLYPTTSPAAGSFLQDSQSSPVISECEPAHGGDNLSQAALEEAIAGELSQLEALLGG
jgi:acyl transferase domain-containing protein/NAD(P)-dependent dehydrogenase (short-subunit alcohol dehydrogenase family)/acyl carrier protein